MGRQAVPMGAPGSAATVMTVYGVDEVEKAISLMAIGNQAVLRAALEEIGLFGEKETKERTPVQYGVLRASIGHFDPSGVKAPDPDDPNPEVPKKGDAFFSTHVQMSGLVSVIWGTNVHYAPYVEHGFTMSPGRTVYITGVGWRFVHPFSYMGAHMFHLGLEQAAKAAGPIVAFHVQNAWNQAVKESGAQT